MYLDKYDFISAKDRYGITDPLLLPTESSHGMKMSSGLMLTPFLENSLQILVTSLSYFPLSMTGTPSTIIELSKLSSY